MDDGAKIWSKRGEPEKRERLRKGTCEIDDHEKN